jgi:hypothetical protein
MYVNGRRLLLSLCLDFFSQRVTGIINVVHRLLVE